MPRTTLTPEQKDMVRELPPREKDKLLLRLIAKDALLLEQLTFTYLEHSATTDERVAELRDFFARLIQPNEHMSPGQLMMRLRQASGYLTRHVRVTKNKLGEVQLLAELLHDALANHLASMRKRHRNPTRWVKFGMYLAKRMPTLLKKADKLHPDLWAEFDGTLNDLLVMIWDTPELNVYAERVGVPRRWEPPQEVE